MKTIRLIFMGIFCLIASHVNAANSDKHLINNLIGTWEHVSTTSIFGDIITYKREIHLAANGKGSCVKLIEGEKTSLEFNWEVVEGTIHLFVFNKRGKRINCDSQFVSHLDDHKMHLKNVFGEEDHGNLACYKRNESAGAQF